VVGGVVVDSRSHAPLANVRVSLAPATARDLKLEQVTKQEGRFSFSIAEPGKYTLQIVKPGYPPDLSAGWVCGHFERDCRS
jgi:Carboxypeptidase regulatory-like domain